MMLALISSMAVSAIAADPIIGTWNLNVAKSKFFPVRPKDMRPPPKQRTEVYREIEGDQIEMTSRETQTDGSSRIGDPLIWPRTGGMVKGGQAPRSWVETLVEPGNWYVTALSDGKQLGIRYKTVSRDGKTLLQTLKGVDASGKPIQQVEVYERQDTTAGHVPR